jgi:vitamin B12 transporter
MNPLILYAVVAAGAAPSQEIVITAERTPVARADTTASASVLERSEIESLGLSFTADALRLLPGVSVAATGPHGSQTQVRIRGAEANHSLLFVDNIRFNDPAAANEARFELLTNDGLAHVEVVRGPQSALWGSEALGGVIAVETADAGRGVRTTGRAEYGSLDSVRAAAGFSIGNKRIGLAGTGNWLRSEGIDAFGAGGDRDGFSTRAASLKARAAASPAMQIRAVFHYVEGRSEFDGFDPLSGAHADTLDATQNRIAAGRAWADVGPAEGGEWHLRLGAGILDSSNKNFSAANPLNRTAGRRSTLDGQIAGRMRLAGTRHRLILAVTHEDEAFKARDQSYFGATDQDRSRTQTALAAELQTDWSPQLSTDFALRHDRFSAFADATTFRAGMLIKASEHWRVHAAYGEGMAQPSFYDLFGFFPNSFVGNPGLRPERSTGWEAGLRWSNGQASIDVTGFSSRLHDEIVDIFDPVTFVASAGNADGISRRRGIELDARRGLGSAGLIRFNYTYLDAREGRVAVAAGVREARRPRHSANLAVVAPLGPVRLGGSIAYVGKRFDTDFDVFPARRVALHAYALTSLDAAIGLGGRTELYGRVENAFGADYEDAFGYATPGRTVYAGLRLRLGD